MDFVSGVSKIFKHDKDQSLYIIACMDIDQEITHEYIYHYVDVILQEYPVLKKRMIHHKNDYFFKEIESFNVDDHLTISEEPFDISTLINKSIDIFHFHWYIDKVNHKNKYAIIIEHSYCDGYKLIEILTKPLEKIKPPEFNRNINIFKKIYHYVVGTIILLIMNIRIVLKIIKNIFNPNNISNNLNKDTEIIFCKSLNFSEIKTFTKSKGITVNDFLFSLMVNADKLYTGLDRELTISLPFNTNHLNSYNNFIPICNTIHNSLDNDILINKVHTLFNHFKYSLFIPISQYIINNIIQFMNINLVTLIVDLYVDQCDYIFTNMIGPSFNNTNISNVCFYTKHKNNAITFNIISYKDNINIICSFKKNLIKNKQYYEECIYKAYENLLNLDSGFFK
jgi:hypothetical protein